MTILIKYGDTVRSFESADAALGHAMMLDRKKIKYTVTPDTTEPRKAPKRAVIKVKCKCLQDAPGGRCPVHGIN